MLRARVRRDLHDEDASQYRWPDSVLDRHLQRAVQEVSLSAPQEATATLVTTAGSRELALSTLGAIVSVEAVEYPTGQYPPCYVPFSTWAGTLTLLVDGAPGASESVRVRYTKLHTLDGSGTTLPDALVELVATGACAYAALEWASYATNRVNVGGTETWRHYHTWAQERMAAFAKSLAKLGRERRVRVGRLYQPQAGASQRPPQAG
jgi:hypothetical protein